MTTTQTQTRPGVKTPAPLNKRPAVLPPPSPLAMPHQNLAVSPSIRRAWRWTTLPGQLLQRLLDSLRQVRGQEPVPGQESAS